MPDREKVIKGLECCDYCNSLTHSCFQCPYIDLNKSDGMSRCTAELAHDALALLKRYETQLKCKDEIIKAADKLMKQPVYCPNCGACLEVNNETSRCR